MVCIAIVLYVCVYAGVSLSLCLSVLYGAGTREPCRRLSSGSMVPRPACCCAYSTSMLTLMPGPRSPRGGGCLQWSYWMVLPAGQPKQWLTSAAGLPSSAMSLSPGKYVTAQWYGWPAKTPTPRTTELNAIASWERDPSQFTDKRPVETNGWNAHLHNKVRAAGQAAHANRARRDVQRRQRRRVAAGSGGGNQPQQQERYSHERRRHRAQPRALHATVIRSARNRHLAN